jgi:hypothetical protein
MDELIEKIRAATVSDVTDEARERGAEACRTLLRVLDAKPGEPLATPSLAPEPALAAPSASPPSPQTAAHMIVSALRGMTPDQLLDLAIARLRAALPAGTEMAAPQPVKFHLVDIRR